MNLVLLWSLVILAAIVVIAATLKAPRLTSVVLWSLVATLFSTASLLILLPGAFSEKALWLALCVPLIWVAFQFWCYWDANKWRVALGLISLSLITGLTVLMNDPIV